MTDFTWTDDNRLMVGGVDSRVRVVDDPFNDPTEWWSVQCGLVAPLGPYQSVGEAKEAAIYIYAALVSALAPAIERAFVERVKGPLDEYLQCYLESQVTK